MKSYVKPITKQLAIAAIFLSFVTVVSLGIRQVRFSLHRARTIGNPVIAEAAPAPPPVESTALKAEPESSFANATVEQIQNEPEPQPVNASDVYKKKPSKDHAKAKSFKGDYAKSKDAKGLEKVSLSGHENLYRTAEGQLWYVNKQPDGKTVKMLVHIDEATGEMMLVDAKSGGSQNLQKISLGKYDNLYITESGEQWYVSEQPDGSVSKSQVYINDSTGEVTVIEDYSDNGKERETKD